MQCTYRKSPPAILLTFFLLTLVMTAHAQKKTGNSQAVAPVIFLDSTKEQDGLIGPVRRVQTETVKLEVKGGMVTEGTRRLLEVTTYNLKGERVDNTYYPVAGPSGSEEYKYDDKGNIVEMTLRGADGSILSREVYAYESDGVGNWTKMTTSLVLFEDGKLRHEPVEATYRTIAYFYDETIAKLLDAHSASTTTVRPSSGSVQPPTTAPKNSIASNAVPPSSPQPKVDPPARNKAQPEKTTGLAEGSKVDSRAGSSTSQPNMERSGSANPSTLNNSRQPAESLPAKENSLPSVSHKAAFDFYKTGREQFNLGNLPAAIEAYQHAIDLEPGFADVYLSLGHAYLRQQKASDAIKAFKEAIKLNPEMYEAHYGLGLEYFRAGKMKDAAESFKKAVRVRPGLAKAHYGLALAYQELGKQDLLLEEFRILERLDPQLAKKLSDSFPEFNLPCAGRRCD